MNRFKDLLEQKLNEAGFSRIAQIMTGLVPTVKTFAIITWENPKGQEADSTFNKQANKILEETLKRGNYSFRQIKGKYGTLENPFFINNIILKEAKRLGVGGSKGEYEQDSIIYGEQFKNKDAVGMSIKLIYIDGRKPLERKIWQNLKDDAVDFYSEYKGRKFVIPFFDEETSNLKFLDGKVISEHNIFYEDDFSQDFNIHINSSFVKLDMLNENISGSTSLNNRNYLYGTINQKLKGD